MESQKQIQNVHTASGINIAAGIWMILSPYILGFSAMSGAVVNNIITGIVIGILALIRVSSPLKTMWLSIVNVVLGLWVIISPFVLGLTSSTVSVWNNVVLGIIITVMAIWSASASTQMTHGRGQV